MVSLALSKMRLAQKAPSYLAVSYYMVIMLLLLLLLLLLLFFLVHSLSVFWPTCPLARELARRLSLMNHVLHNWSHCWVREGKKWSFATRKHIIKFMTISLHGMRWRGGGGGGVSVRCNFVGFLPWWSYWQAVRFERLIAGQFDLLLNFV